MSRRAPAPSPPSSAVCGNGVLDAIPGPCVEICAGGCDGPITCHVECTTDHEHCDGAAASFTCASEGYAGGQMGCTKDCQLDLSPCVACVPGPGVRCGAVALSGDEVFVVGGAASAAVFARTDETGRLVGARVRESLITQRFAGLPGKTLAAGALDGGLGYVDEQRRFGVIDGVTGQARTLGPIGEDSTPILLLRETFHAGGAAVLTGHYGRRTLAIFDPPAPIDRAAPRHFHLDNLRVVVVPGAHELARGVTQGGADLAVLAFGNEVFAYQRKGLELTPLKAPPAGVALTFVYPRYADTLRWSTGELATSARTAPDTSAPPPGLSRAALSGASMASAFGGVLMARRADGSRPRAELYWITGVDPLAPTDPSPSKAVAPRAP